MRSEFIVPDITPGRAVHPHWDLDWPDLVKLDAPGSAAAWNLQLMSPIDDYNLGPMEPQLEFLKGFIVDLDGVLWRGGEALPGSREFIEHLETRSFPYIVATNEPAIQPAELAARLQKLNVPVAPDRILTAGWMAVEELRQTHPAGAAVHVIGADSLKEMVLEAGFSTAKENIEAVVVTLYESVEVIELNLAIQALNRGADFLAPNREMTYPIAEGVGAGDGMLVVALEAATGRQAQVLGKPSPDFFRIALSQINLPPEEVLVVGDNLETDIAGGQRAGTRTALVLTGMTDEELLSKSSISADWVFEDLTELTYELSQLPFQVGD